MREIKFRAWHDGEMYDVDDLRFNVAGVSYAHLIQPSGRMLYHTPDMSKIELMQFTGLLDEQGREVYESDIVEYAAIGVRGVVTWMDPGLFYCVRHANAIHGIHNGWTIIGNIYENPDLVEEPS